MLAPKTKILTDRGIFYLYRVLPGMLVETDRGFRQVQYSNRRAVGYRKKTLFFGTKKVICDKHQAFYVNDVKTSVLSLKVGDSIDSKYGPMKITKTEIFFSKKSFYTLKVFNYEKKFYLHNGILTTYG